MSRTIALSNNCEQYVTVEPSACNRVVLKESSETGSTTIDMTRSEALDLAMALIEAAKP
jgi:hypothetical protein